MLHAHLIDTLVSLDDAAAHLIDHENGEPTLYLLYDESLIIATVEAQPVFVTLERIGLANVAITKSCHDIEGNGNGRWTTTWRLSDDTGGATITGREGPQFADEPERFARQIAERAGWPLARDTADEVVE